MIISNTTVDICYGAVLTKKSRKPGVLSGPVWEDPPLPEKYLCIKSAHIKSSSILGPEVGTYHGSAWFIKWGPQVVCGYPIFHTTLLLVGSPPEAALQGPMPHLLLWVGTSRTRWGTELRAPTQHLWAQTAELHWSAASAHLYCKPQMEGTGVKRLSCDSLYTSTDCTG